MDTALPSAVVSTDASLGWMWWAMQRCNCVDRSRQYPLVQRDQETWGVSTAAHWEVGLMGWAADRASWLPACANHGTGFGFIAFRWVIWPSKWSNLGCLHIPPCLMDAPSSLSKDMCPLYSLTQSSSTLGQKLFLNIEAPSLFLSF